MQRYHPEAWLSDFKNVKTGLERRSEILCLLEEDTKTAKELSAQINVTYSTILYHLHNMERRGVIDKATTKAPYKWRLTSARRRRLNQYFI